MAITYATAIPSVPKKMAITYATATLSAEKNGRHFRDSHFLFSGYPGFRFY
jgi:hypothetical protein